MSSEPSSGLVYARPGLNRARGRRFRDWVRPIVTALLVLHLAAITMANVSRTTALGTVFHRPFDLYVGLFRLDQSWDMFITIPHFYDMDGWLVAIDEKGHETRYGPMLPGLHPYPKDPRIHSMFMRLAFLSNGYPGYSERYLSAVCRAVKAKTGIAPKSVAFDLRAETLRSLEQVRKDGRLGEPKVTRYGPSACPQ